MTDTPPSIDGQLLDTLETLLEGRSRDDAITSSEISDRLGLEDGEASPKAREAITVLMAERKLPVRSGPQGYWICQTQQEADEYLDSLTGRIQGIQTRQQRFREAWDAYTHQDDDRDDSDEIPADVREQLENDPVLTVDDYYRLDMAEVH